METWVSDNFHVSWHITLLLILLTTWKFEIYSQLMVHKKSNHSFQPLIKKSVKLKKEEWLFCIGLVGHMKKGGTFDLENSRSFYWVGLKQTVFFPWPNCYHKGMGLRACLLSSLPQLLASYGIPCKLFNPFTFLLTQWIKLEAF